jgi:hypothetical protein
MHVTFFVDGGLMLDSVIEHNVPVSSHVTVIKEEKLDSFGVKPTLYLMIHAHSDCMIFLLILQ